VLGLAIDNTLRHRPLPATTPDTDTVNNITLNTKNTKLSKIIMMTEAAHSYSKFSE
jgi:hypothetical protein